MTYYIGTVLLNMTPKVFWKTTPKKFNALCKMHAKVNNPDDDKTTRGSKGQGKPKTKQPIGAPDTFIDQL